MNQPASVQGHVEVVQSLSRHLDAQLVIADQITAIIQRARFCGGTLFVMGNGGSAASALHFANDLTAAPRDSAPRIKVKCLSSNVSLLSAIANDEGYERIFVSQLEGFLTAIDIVFLLSVSGNSDNCVEAAMYSKSVGATTIAFLGCDGGRLRKFVDAILLIPSWDYRAVEDVHMILAHGIASSLSSVSFGDALCAH